MKIVIVQDGQTIVASVAFNNPNDAENAAHKLTIADKHRQFNIKIVTPELTFKEVLDFVESESKQAEDL